MAKAAVAKPEKKEMVFWVAENDGMYVIGSPGSEALFNEDIELALKFADENSVNRFILYLNFVQYEAVEHSMMV